MADQLDQIKRDAMALIASLRNDWDRMATAQPEERADILVHMRYALEEMTGLVREVEADA